ncbi:MlaD family protein [Acidiferrimicrobium sp. IK]|uniref:MlaD family protein n=1 Tax=Acidiferrimicrobium sp. IK TaxID=2871700 RepID=UPI0021CB4A98|nr:MlaD family protein [Acidiferrimicrobium sp. IK]MCU4184405.1 MlaD family protein [Acidiferrimicrobium sp. IK]
MFRRPLPINAKLVGAIAVAVFVLAAYIGYTAISGPPFYPYSYVTIHYKTASNVVIHSDVRINTERVGQVSKVAYRNGQAVVTAQMNPGTKIYKNASASIGAVSPLGTEYVEINPGTPSAGPAPAGGIPVGRTTEPVEIDTVLSILNPKVSQSLSTAIQTLGTGVAGEGQNINDLIGASPTLLPNLGTTMSTLADPSTNLTGLIDATNLLSTRFAGRTQQLAALLGQMDTTLQAVNVNDTTALRQTLSSTAPALTAAVPALQALTSAAAATGNALTTLRPGLAAAGAGTPALRSLLRDGVQPLERVPGVSQQATPAFNDLAGTNAQLERPVAPFLAQLINQSQPLLSYLAPYSVDIFSLFSNLSSALSQGNADGKWLRIDLTEQGEALGGAAGSPAALSAATQCRDPYPAPGQAYQDVKTGACP